MPTHHKRILFFPFDLLSHYLRCIELAKQYPSHEIWFISSRQYNPLVEKAGYHVFSSESFDPQMVIGCAARFDFSWLNREDIERIALSQRDAIRELKPVQVIGDATPTLKLSAELAGVPFTALMNGYMSIYYACSRALSRTHPSYPLVKRLPPIVANVIVNFAEKVSFRLVHKPFRELRKKYRLSRISDYLHELEGDNNLICDELRLFPQKPLPSNYRVIGPLMYENNEPHFDLQSLLQQGRKKVILVCMGSSGNWEPLEFLSSAAYAEFLIITAGDKGNCIKGNHVVNKEFVSLSAILPNCDVMICHGGNGTIYHGLRHGVPMLCLTSHFEQEWNVQRLEALGLGRSINDDPQGIVGQLLWPENTSK